MKHITHNFQMWINGVLCNLTGYVEPADRSVGIMADGFIAETIVRADTGEAIADLPDGQYLEVEQTFFDSQPTERYVFQWRKVPELANRKAHACEVLRYKLVKRYAMPYNGTVLEHVGDEWQLETCGAPLFGSHEQFTGECRSCANGWNHAENYRI